MTGTENMTSKLHTRLTHLNRRTILSGGAAVGATAILPPIDRAFADTGTLIEPRPSSTSLLGARQPTTDIWGFDGLVPGPLLRVKQGDELNVKLKNGLKQPTTIHWHGIRIDNAMDGVPGLTQRPVAPGETFAYRFRCPDAGTFWYHPHKLSSEQVGRGLHGALIVEELSPPTVDQDRVLIFDDWRLTDDGQIHAASFGAIHDRAHAGRTGNTFTLNGTTSHDVRVRSGQRLRLRLINVANANIFAVRFTGHRATIIAVDGQPASPHEAPEGLVVLGPAQRADVIIDAMGEPGSTAKIEMLMSRRVETVGRIVYSKQTPLRREPLDGPILLPPNPLTTRLDLDNAVDIDLPMEGGAMSRMAGAKVQGEWMGLRDMVRNKGYAWALAGQAGMPKEPLFRVKLGQTIRMTMRNQTMWPHAMHIHGHHFIEVGASPSEEAWRDTTLLFREQEKTVAFVADNPGKWMLHCHMLEHHEAGMGTWFEVTA